MGDGIQTAVRLVLGFGVGRLDDRDERRTTLVAPVRCRESERRRPERRSLLRSRVCIRVIRVASNAGPVASRLKEQHLNPLVTCRLDFRPILRSPIARPARIG